MAYYTTTASVDLTTKGRWLRAFNVAETAGSPAIVNLRNGSVSGDIVIQLRFPTLAGGSDRTVSFGSPGLNFPTGLYLEKNSGTIQASVDLW